jgi:hypothetical protein
LEELERRAGRHGEEHRAWARGDLVEEEEEVSDQEQQQPRTLLHETQPQSKDKERVLGSVGWISSGDGVGGGERRRRRRRRKRRRRRRRRIKSISPLTRPR